MDLGHLPSMEQLLGQHVNLGEVRKIGEGTFGEAFKAGGVVFKIVPMEGQIMVRALKLYAGTQFCCAGSEHSLLVVPGQQPQTLPRCCTWYYHLVVTKADDSVQTKVTWTFAG